MKKIIALMLVLVLCVTAVTSCGKKVKPKKVLAEISEMYSNSAPTMIIAKTTQTIGSYQLNCEYSLKTGKIDGASASVYTVTQQELESPDVSGSSDIIKPFIKTTTKTTEAIEGIGARVNGGDWNPEGTISVIGRGAMALDLTKDNVTEVAYTKDETTNSNILTFVILNENIGSVLGDAYATGIEGDIKATIINDGSVITSIELRYTLAGNSSVNLGTSEMVVYVEYQYDIQQITIS